MLLTRAGAPGFSLNGVMKLPDQGQSVKSFFLPGGPLERVQQGYESRPSQADMAERVAAALWSGQVAAIEAGTGTGKSLAYVIPAALWSRETGQRVVISTHTINLQEQLIHNDIPLARQTIGGTIKAMLVKGRSNYLCWRRIQETQHGMGRFAREERAALQEILRATPRVKYGDRSEFSMPITDAIWSSVASDGESCLRGACPYQEMCFIQKLRRDASTAELLVVNHFLFLADVALKGTASGGGGVLPPYGALIVDEAHHIEDVATEYFGREADGRDWQRLWEEVYRRQGRRPHGHLVTLREFVAGLETMPDRAARLQAIDEAVDPVLGAMERGAQWFDMVARMVRADGSRDAAETRLRVREGFCAVPGFEELALGLDDLSTVAGEARQCIRRVCQGLQSNPAVESSPNALGALMALAACADRSEAMVSLAGDVIGGPRKGHVAWLECRPSEGGLRGRLLERPLSVSEPFFRQVIEPLDAAVFTSATLAAGGSLAYWGSRVGLDHIHPQDRLEAVIPSPFPYREQVYLAVPSDLPEPDGPGFVTRAAGFLAKAMKFTGGRAFLLFTSYSMLTETYVMLCDELKAAGLTVLRQGEDTRAALLARFKESGRGVLFGTNSFWEGVDVPGEALSCVVMVKLPFAVPSEPLQQARAEEVEHSGRSPFVELALPQAALRFKQGFGRLIRRRTDRGAVLVLDRRLMIKPYGAVFLRSLPDCQCRFAASEEILNGLRKWFEGDENTAPAEVRGNNAIRTP